MSDDMPARPETLRRLEQARALLTEDGLATLAAIDRDIETLRECAKRAVIAEAQVEAMCDALDIWRKTTIRALLDEGAGVEAIELLLDRVETQLARQLPHVAAGLQFDVRREIALMLDEIAAV